MRRFFLLMVTLVVVLCANPIDLSAQTPPGDTVVVQTFTYDSILTRRAWFEFPPDTGTYEKIWMYYSLKCDPATAADGFDCGEWDYLTYTYLYDYTGEYDSTLLSQPTYVVDGASPDPFSYTNTQAWMYSPRMELCRDAVGPGVTGATRAPGGTSNSDILDGSLASSRSQFLWQAADIPGAGTSDTLAGMALDILTPGSELQGLTIRMKNTSLDSLQTSNLQNGGFTTVYQKNTTFTSTGFDTLAFTAPFIWDGSSNIMVDVTYNNTASTGTATSIDGDNAHGYNNMLSTSGNDFALDFEGTDWVEVPAGAFSGVSSEITISFWQYGDPDIQPQNDYAFEGRDASGNRVVNVHLPWSNKRVYWDAGNSGSSAYDRIDKEAVDANFEGQWNHWAFTKNATSGQMRIYLNGSLWHSGTGLNRTMSPITSFRIGSRTNGSGNYDGMIDEFRVWDKALSASEIADWMEKSVTASHPSYANLILYYPFNEGTGTTTADMAPGGYDGNLMGAPSWYGIPGAERFLDYSASAYLPDAEFLWGDDTFMNDTIWVIDSMPVPPLTLVMYENPADPPTATDTLLVWEPWYMYEYDSNGVLVDSTMVGADSTLNLGSNDYYSDPFEVVVRYELGRFITPYGINLDLGPNGFMWRYDVTDFEPLLHDSVEISAGNLQELLDLRFEFIEGTPPRDVIKVQNLWNGNFSATSMSTSILPLTVKMDSAGGSFKFRAVATGHGNPGCAEFCYNTHSLRVNGFTLDSWEIMQECSDNPVYPQGGTWIFDRAGWCPGAPGRLEEVDITNLVTPGVNASIDYNAGNLSAGNYVLETTLIHYGPDNFSLDAALADIIAPNDWEFRGRVNPICGNPVVVIRNTGSTHLTSLDITYGIQGGTMQTFNWTGNLNLMEEEEVVLDDLIWDGTGEVFEASVSNPNGGTDEYSANNTLTSTFDTPLTFQPDFVFKIRTNTKPGETRYELLDTDDNILYSSSPFWGANSTYTDTFRLGNGCFKLRIYDTDDDGIDFWYPPTSANDGAGYIELWRTDGTKFYTFEPDFGDGHNLEFFVTGSTHTENEIISNRMDVFPNPTNGNLKVWIDLAAEQNVQIEVWSMLGQRVMQKDLGMVKEFTDEIDLSGNAEGIYFVKVITPRGELSRKVMLR